MSLVLGEDTEEGVLSEDSGDAKLVNSGEGIQSETKNSGTEFRTSEVENRSTGQGLAKRRIRSAGPRLDLGRNVEDQRSDDVVTEPVSSPSSALPQAFLVSEKASGEVPISVTKAQRIIVVRSDAKPLEGLNLNTSISPNVRFKALNSLLQQNSETKRKTTEGGDPATPSPLDVPGRLLVLDPAVGFPAKEKLSQLVEDCARQPRIVSVEREQCHKKEHAAMFLEKDKAAKQHSAVTVSRSHTWSFQDKNAAVEAGSTSGRRLPLVKNSSVLEKLEKLPASRDDAEFSDEVDQTENCGSSGNGVDQGDGKATNRGEVDGETSKGRAKSMERHTRNMKKCLLRSNSALVGYTQKGDHPKTACHVSFSDLQPDPKVGLLSKNGGCDRKNRSTEDELMESNAGVTSPDEGLLIQRCVIIHRDEKGFGFTVCGHNPVLVDKVKLNGPAYKAGVRQRDQIIKVNGTLVLNCNHPEVVQLIKSGPYVALTLLGRQQQVHPAKVLDSLEQNASLPTPSIPGTPSIVVDKDRISCPQAVDQDKDLQFKAQRAITIQMMYKQLLEEYEKMKLEYEKSPSEGLQGKLNVKLQMLRRVEEQLRAIESTHASQVTSPVLSSSSSVQSPSLESSSGHPLKWPVVTSSVAVEGVDGVTGVTGSSSASVVYRGPTPWLPGGVKHRKADSMPDTLYKIEEDATLGSGSRSQRFMEAGKKDAQDADVEMKMVPGSVVSSGESCGRLGFPSSSSSSSPSASEPGFLPGHETPQVMVEGGASPIVPLQQLIRSSASKPPLKVISPDEVTVVVMEDSDFTTVDDPGAFSDLMQLKHRPAHMAVFLHYLISNSDPAAMFFYLVTESYSLGTIKEMRKWAYEIFSTFLCHRAPLKVNVDEATVNTVSTTLQTKHDRDDTMKNIFQSARVFAQNEINDHLTDFRSKRALGLGSLYGDRDLKDNMDRQTEMRIVESALWKHFERLVQDEDTDRSQALASALVTFFKQVGYTNQKCSSVVERCSSFNAKDNKKVFKFKTNTKKMIHSNGHQFMSQHYFVTTSCFLCQNILWGIGNQGYQCTNCEVNLHKSCVELYKDSCFANSTLRKKKERRPPSMFDLISRKLSNTNPAAIKEAQHQHFGIDSSLMSPAAILNIRPGLPESDETDQGPPSISSNNTGTGSMAPESEKSPEYLESLVSTSRDHSPDYYEEDYNPSTLSVGLGRSESLNHRGGIRASVRRTHSDVSPDNQMLSTQRTNNNSGSSSNSSLSARTSDSSEGISDISSVPPSSVVQKSQFSDSDFDVEIELPLLESVISKELFRKLKPKEKKRQDVINELFYTERTHVRNLKVLHQLFYLPMADDPLALLLFPNLNEIIEIHCALNNEFKAKRKGSPVIGDFASILVKRFSGEEGDKFKMAAAKFCEQQSHALEALRLRQRKDQKLAMLLQEASSNSLCRRLELKDLILMELQRLTKYPLFIESLLKYTFSNTDEYSQLVKAHELSKNLLNHVNQRFEECENHQKLVELQRRLDRRPIENSNLPVVSEYKKLDLTRHKMIHDGILTWRISRSKHIDHHVVLLEDILVLLQKQDERLVLRVQTTGNKDDNKLPHSPVIKLSELLTRNVAVDKRAFFLVSMASSSGPQIYELAAGTKDDRNKWFKYITDAVDAIKTTESHKVNRPGQLIEESPLPHVHEPTPDDVTPGKSQKLSDRQADDGTDTEPDEKRGSSENLESLGRVEVLNFEPPQLVQPNEVKVSCMEVMEKLEPVKTSLDLLKEKNRIIEMTMLEKKRLLSRLLQIPFDDYDHMAEIAGEVVDSQDARELLFGSLAKADELTNLINEGLNESLQGTIGRSKEKGDGNLQVRGGNKENYAASSPSSAVTSTCLETTQLARESSHSSASQTDRSVMSGPAIVLSSSRLMSITGQLHQHLAQLLDVILKKDSERADLRAAATEVRVHDPASQMTSECQSSSRDHVSCAQETVEEITEVTTEQPRCVEFSASLVTFPVVMEHVELIEVETIVPEPSTVDPIEPSDETDTARVNVFSAGETEQSTLLNSRRTT